MTNNGGSSSSVLRVVASSGAIGGNYPVGFNNPVALAFDGANMWVANSGSGTVSKIPVN